MYNLEFKKSIINIHEYFQNNNYSNNEFLNMIDKCFNIKKTTFYNWSSDDNIINSNIIFENNNKLVNTAVETYIVNLFNDNKKIGIKTIKKKIKSNFKITINNKTISYILFKNNIKHKNIKNIDVYDENKKNKKNNIEFIILNEEQINFILDNKTKLIKDIINLVFEKYKIKIHQKQIIDIMHQNKLVVKSFFKSSPSLVNFIIKSMENNKILTVKEIKELIYKEFKLDISTQLIYNKLKENGYVYKKFKINNNPYKLEEQVEQFEKITEVHNSKNIDNCVSLDEISFVLNSKPSNGWFKKNEVNEIHVNNKKIISQRFSLLVASSNEKILKFEMCKKGVKTDFFINFMKELKDLDPDNKKYYLLDNARVHKTKKFNKFSKENDLNMIYNAPYHSETNPIENIFSMFRNYLNKQPNKSESELKQSIENFIQIDNKEKFKNIFNHSCNVIDFFIKKNKIAKP
jgi:hypothetical protein